MVKSDYIPIDCNLYDYIELFAVKNIHVHICYRSEKGCLIQLLEKIYQTETTSEKEEFLILRNGVRIRMDRLKKIENIKF